MGGFLFLQRFPLAHQFGLLGGERVPVYQLIEIRICQPLELLVHFGDFALLLGGMLCGGLGGNPLFFINPFQHVFRPFRRQGEWLDYSRNLRVQKLLPDKRLGATLCAAALGTSVVNVSLLDLRRYGVAALPTTHQPHEGFNNAGRRFGRPAKALVDDILNRIEKLFRNDRLVLSHMNFSGVAEMTVIEWVRKNL